MNTITKNNVIPLLIKACPSFKKKLETYLKDEKDNERLLYAELGEFARHLIELHKQGTTNEFDSTFKAIEDLHVNGNHYVKEAATIGLFEGIQNNASHDDTFDAEVFIKFLHPVSLKQWNNLNDFWNGKS